VPESISGIRTSRTGRYFIATAADILGQVGSRLRALASDAEHALMVTGRNVEPLYAG
jgi:hypothetical protein